MEGITLQAVPMMPRSQGTPIPVKTQGGDATILSSGKVRGSGDDVAIKIASAEQAHQQTLQRTTAIANPYVVGDQSVTFYKDATGQYVTRFKSLRDGTVTYIPKPTLPAGFGSASRPRLILDA